MRLKGLMTAVIAGLVFSTSQALAFPITSTKKPSMRDAVGILYEGGFNFDGIIAMSNCSASFVRFKNSRDADRGMVLTNGHCMGGMFGGMIQPGEVYYNKPRNFNLSLLNREAGKIASLRAEKIVYATMTDTDVAVLELTQSYADIERQTGIKPLMMSDVRPQAGTKIEVPSGYWKRTYTCQIEAFIPQLKEADWMFKDSVRYSETGCEVVGGTSGSPIVASETGVVIAINNTGNEGGAACTMNNPCEIDESGKKSTIAGRGYGQQIYTISTCLNVQGTIDLSVQGCVLPKPR